MSGYDSISDYAFNEFPVKDFDNFQDWIEALEADFLDNGKKEKKKKKQKKKKKKL